MNKINLFFPVLLALAAAAGSVCAGENRASSGSLDLPAHDYGLSIGNSANFSGLRINFRDKNVECINGLNLTIWRSDQNKTAVVNGLSLSLLHEAGELNGISLGALGMGAERKMRGVNVGVVGIGAGESLAGLNFGGIGLGAGENVSGVNLGGIGVGAGGNLKGINFGGIGAGAGGDVRWITVGGLGAGAGRDMLGLNIGGLGVGAGRDLTGISLALLGAGAGRNMSGINLAGIGVVCGNALRGISFGGIGAGAPRVQGLAIGGVGAGGVYLDGVILAAAFVTVADDGRLRGFSASAFNQIKGTQSGVAMGIVNYARRLNGVQIGVINYVRDNPKFLKVLPVLNVHLD